MVRDLDKIVAFMTIESGVPMTLQQVEAIVDSLDPQDQVKLLNYLAPRIAEREKTNWPPGAYQQSVDAPFSAGELLKRISPPGASSLIEGLTEMRQ